MPGHVVTREHLELMLTYPSLVFWNGITRVYCESKLLEKVTQRKVEMSHCNVLIGHVPKS